MPSSGIRFRLYFVPSSLCLQEKSAEARAQVQSRSPRTPYGVFQLDEVPDVAEILLLSDEFKLDEIDALLLVLRAQEEVGDVSAAAAAGLLFEQRSAAVQSLSLLLHAQIVGAANLPPAVYDIISAFNAGLLCQAEADGGCMLLRRLTALLHASPVDSEPGTRLPVVIDSLGRAADRALLAQRERTSVAECLLSACCIRQRVPAADVRRLLDTLRHLSLKARASGDTASALQASLCLVACLLVLLPAEGVEGAVATADEVALNELAADRQLDATITAMIPSEDPFAAPIRLAWGLLLLTQGPATAGERGVAEIKTATEAGVLQFLAGGVLEGAGLEDEPPERRQLCASVVHQLAMEFIVVAE
jgi:hypothetical protein